MIGHSEGYKRSGRGVDVEIKGDLRMAKKEAAKKKILEKAKVAPKRGPYPGPRIKKK